MSKHSLKVKAWYELEVRKETICIFLIFMFLFLPIALHYMTRPPEYIDLESRGVKARIRPEVSLINRFTESFESRWIEDMPLMASNDGDEIFPFRYVNSFETPENISSVTGINVALKQDSNRVYHGDNSLEVVKSSGQPGVLDLNIDEKMAFNESFDIAMWLYLQHEINNGYFALHFTLNSSMGQERFTILIQNGTTNGYVAEENEILMENPFGRRYWKGLFVDNIKNMSMYDLGEEPSSNLMNMNLTVDTGSAFRFYLDYVYIKEIPVDPAGFWYEDDESKSDFLFSVEYEIRVDSSVIENLDEIVFRANYYSDIMGESLYFGPVLMSSIYLSNLTWIEEDSGIFDMKSSGIYTAPLVSLPYRPFWGKQLTWEVHVDLSVFGTLINGEVTRDDALVEFPDIITDWQVPIEIDGWN